MKKREVQTVEQEKEPEKKLKPEEVKEEEPKELEKVLKLKVQQKRIRQLIKQRKEREEQIGKLLLAAK